MDETVSNNRPLKSFIPESMQREIKFLKLWHLQELLDNNSDLYSPNGEKMIVVSNGFLGGQLLYDTKNKKVYGLKLVDITKSANNEFIEQCEYYRKRKQVELSVNKKNVDRLLEVIDNLK